MANMPAAEYAISTMKLHPKLTVGLHLVLTIGCPASPQTSRLVSDGCFRPLSQVAKLLRSASKETEEEIRAEWRAQIQKAQSLGLAISHFDSHHGVHKYPLCRRILIGLMKEFEIKCVRAAIRSRWPGQKRPGGLLKSMKKIPAMVNHRLNERAYSKHGFRYVDQYLNIASFPFQDQQTAKHLASAIRALPDGVTEMAFHPGLPDPDDTYDRPEYAEVRKRDLSILTSPEVREAIKESNVSLISYRDLLNNK